MYNQHYAKLCLDELNDFTKATPVIQEEIENRLKFIEEDFIIMLELGFNSRSEPVPLVISCVLEH